jgi:uncharacterized protein (TIGR04255 family)
MNPATHYSKAPITEALIDLRATVSEHVAVSDLMRCHEGQEKAYPHKKDLKIGYGQFEVGHRLSASASAQHVGFLFSSGDQKQVYQVRLNGFSMNRMAPYESWEPFRDEARRLWTLYRETIRPTQVERLAVRYINRLDLPGPRIELKDYLRTSPEVSTLLPQSLASFFMQLNLPLQDIRCTLLLNETIIEPARPEVVSLVLDIDLFRTDDVPQVEEGIWEFFEVLHVRKNDVFEACITNRTRELIR